MTQDEYKLFTGESVSYKEQEWTTLVGVASGRLASFLCMENLPETLPDDLKMLLAAFMSSVFAHQGSEGAVASKSVRNFTITFQTNASRNAFSYIASQYADIVGKYAKCDSGLKVEGSRRHCCECL